MKFIAKTFHGLETILAQEITNLGANNIQILKRAVSFEGDQRLMYAANYLLRTATRILKPIYSFTARSERQLYHKISSYNWSMHFDNDKTFAIHSVLNSPYFNHSQYVSFKTKDAIVDQFRKKTGRRPSVDTQNPDIVFNVHVYNDEFTISLDSTGDSLHKRGYRDVGHLAPLNEVLAAGMILLSGWDKEQTLLDPMCGTGTILFEAAMIGTQTPSGFYKKEKYTFTNWKDYDDDLFQEIKKNADQKIDTTSLNLVGGDIAPAAVNMVLNSIDALGFEHLIQVSRIPFKRNLPTTDNGILIANPPYGERLKIKNISTFYKEIGDTLKQNFSGWDAWILSSNLEALKNVGLRPSKKITLFNAALECKFQKFSMYQGSKKTKKESL